MQEGYIATVLGAGASVGCGYPLANNFFPAVKAFGDSLGVNCRQLRKVIEYEVAKAQELITGLSSSQAVYHARSLKDVFPRRKAEVSTQ